MTIEEQLKAKLPELANHPKLLNSLMVWVREMNATVAQINDAINDGELRINIEVNPKK